MKRFVLSVLCLFATVKFACAPVTPPERPCTGSDACLQNEYCAKAEGECGSEAACEARPDVCSQIYDPVCGCDGITYANACEASRAGASMSAKGQCLILPPPPAVCTDSTACAENEYCNKEVGACGSDGTCASLPDACAQVYDPVCGCDGTTYGNACEAALAGVSIASAGACTPPPPPLGSCSTNLQCGPSDYCKKAAGDCSGYGSCTARPQVCMQLYAPVTGCNNLTYSNSCEAARAGVNVQ